MERYDRLQEPDAVIPLVRIREGGDPQGSSLPRPRESDKLWPLSTPLDPSVLLLESPCPYFTQSLVLNMSQKRTFARVLIKKRQPLLK